VNSEKGKGSDVPEYLITDCLIALLPECLITDCLITDCLTMKKQSNLLTYLLLNIFVSAVTTLVVLWVWDHVRQSSDVTLPQVLVQSTVPGVIENTPAASSGAEAPLAVPSASSGAEAPLAVPSAAGVETASPVVPTPAVPVETAGPTETMPPAGSPLIQIISVVGAGDLEQEVVMLKRAGEGNLRMVGWKLEGEHNNNYTFPEQPELTLYKDGAVQIYTKTGTDSVTEVYLNRAEAAWRSGELIRLLDPQGTERATYRVP
jgi:hypothetical protein